MAKLDSTTRKLSRRRRADLARLRPERTAAITKEVMADLEAEKRAVVAAKRHLARVRELVPEAHEALERMRRSDAWKRLIRQSNEIYSDPIVYLGDRAEVSQDARERFYFVVTNRAVKIDHAISAKFAGKWTTVRRASTIAALFGRPERLPRAHLACAALWLGTVVRGTFLRSHVTKLVQISKRDAERAAGDPSDPTRLDAVFYREIKARLRRR